MSTNNEQADGFVIERSIYIAARDATVFEFIDNLRQWELWNPNGRGDLSVERTYGDVARGVGATSTWRSRRSGAGTMRITNSTAPSEIVVEVHFDRPFKARNVNTFRLHSSNTETRVVWSMHGPKPLLAKFLGLFVNMDKMLAKHFDEGLANLKVLAEKR